jgi:hypothetical protein
MMNFTFNLLDRLPAVKKLYANVANSVNKNVLERELFDPELLANVFDALDSFWLKHGKTDWYSESEIRVITGMVLETLRDNDLSSKEVRKLVRFVVSVWRPEIAEKKAPSPVLEKVEGPALRAVEIYRKLNQQIDVDGYVSKVSKVIGSKMPDNQIVNSLLKVFR